jgi:hypothetical protein
VSPRQRSTPQQSHDRSASQRGRRRRHHNAVLQAEVARLLRETSHDNAAPATGLDVAARPARSRPAEI